MSEKQIERRRAFALETDPRGSMAADYLDTLLPENWEDLDSGNRCEHVDMRRQDAHDIITILRKLGWENAEKTSRILLYGRQRMWERISRPA
jgi:hypothetical protein